jgi:non-homologous end joining protein Ku
MPKASASSVTLQFGLMSVTGDLYNAVGERAQDDKPVKVSLTSCCPTCHEEDAAAVKIGTAYVCDKGHGPFKRNEVLKATGTGKNLTIVADAETITDQRKAVAEETGPGRTCTLVAYPAEDVLASTFPVATPLVFEPSDPSQTFELFRLAGEDGRISTEVGDVVLIGEVQLRSDAPAKLVTLRTRQGLLLLQELARPEDVRDFDAPATVDVAEAWSTQFVQVLTLTRETWDASSHRSVVKDRVAELIASLTGEDAKILPLSPVGEDKEDVDVSAQLAAMIAAAKSA